jgi:hypothetical protein
MKTRANVKSSDRRNRNQSNPRERTNVPGQNPKADDSAEKDENHDESRVNPLENAEWREWE